MNAEELFEQYEYLAAQTLLKMYYNPKSVGKKYRIDYEDLLQYAMTGLWLACKSYKKNKSKFSTFAINSIRWHLLKKLRTDCKNRLYRENKQCNGKNNEEVNFMSMDAIIGDEEDDTLHSILPSKVNVEEEAISNIRFNLLYGLLDREQKEILKLREKGMTYREIGELWGMTGSNVKAKIYKARKVLEQVI